MNDTSGSGSSPGTPETPKHDAYAAIRIPDFRRFLIGSLLAAAGGQALFIGVGWEVYERTQSAMALACVGLAIVAPVIFFTLLAGHVADHYPRKIVVFLAQVLRCWASLGLMALSVFEGPVEWIYACLFAIGSSRAFQGPARVALVPQIVPPEHFANSVTWSTSGFHLSSVAGPALGGALIGLGDTAWPAFLLDAICSLGYGLFVLSIRTKPAARKPVAITRASLLAGLSFVWNTKLILAAITLDLFAVLLGGATALLPIYAKDILRVGPEGYGWLRAAEAIGALAMAVTLAHRPPLRRAGRALLWSVAGFGLSIVVFGLSTHYWLSLAAIAASGAFDNVSMVVRGTLVQLRTPDEMRGRVAAVTTLFVWCSNEVGQFESGTVAHYFGPVASVVSGGVGTLLVVAATALKWPELRRLGRIEDPVRAADKRETGDAEG